MITIPEIISSVVEKMSIYPFTNVLYGGDGTYTISLTNLIDADDWRVGSRCGVTADGIVYYYGLVTQVRDEDLSVTLYNNVVLPSIIGLIMDINYQHGHPLDVFNQLNKMAQDPDHKKRRFPFIALMQDFEEDVEEGIDETPIKVIIGFDSDKNWTAHKRYTETFYGKRLLKIYERFIKYLRVDRNSYFQRKDHTKTDRLYWGREGAFGNEANMSGDFIDAIELNIDLKTFNNC